MWLFDRDRHQLPSMPYLPFHGMSLSMQKVYGYADIDFAGRASTVGEVPHGHRCRLGETAIYQPRPETPSLDQPDQVTLVDP